MKFNKNLVALSVAGVMTAGAAQASTLTVTPITVASEATSLTTGTGYEVSLASGGADLSPLGNDVSSDILWTTSFGLNTGDLITFTLTNARFKNDDYYLMAEESSNGFDIDGDGDALDTVEVATNFGVVDSVNGVSTITVRINNALNLPTGTAVFLKKTNADLADGADIVNDLQNPTIEINPGVSDSAPFDNATDGAVTIASAGTNSGGTNIPAAVAAATTLFEIRQQFQASITTEADSEIVINATPQSRTFFSDETAANNVFTDVASADTDEDQSAAVFTVDNDSASEIEDFIPDALVTAADTFTVTVTGTNLNNLDATAGAQAFQLGTVNVDDADFALTLGTDEWVGSADGDDLPNRGAAITDKLALTVDGTVLSDREFDTAFLINFDDANLVDAATAAADSHAWALSGGGAILHTPLASMNSNFNHRVTLTNRSTTDAAYRVSAVGEDGCTVTLNTGFTDGSASLAAESSTSVFVADIVDTVTCTTGNPNRVGLTFDIEASTQDIQGIIQLVNVAAGDVVTSNYLVRNGTN